MKVFLALGLCLQIMVSGTSWASTSQIGADERAFFAAVERPLIKPRQNLSRWFVSAESLLWRSALGVLSDKVGDKLATAGDCEIAMWVAARNESIPQSLNRAFIPVLDALMTGGLSVSLSAFSMPGKIILSETLHFAVGLFNRSTFGVLETKNIPKEVVRTLLNITAGYTAPLLADDYLAGKITETALRTSLNTIIDRENLVVSRTETTNQNSKVFSPKQGLPLVKVNVVLVYSPYTHFVTIFVRGVGEKCSGNRLFVLQYEVDKNGLYIRDTLKERPVINLESVRPQPGIESPRLANQPTIMGQLTSAENGKLYVAPLVIYKDGVYRSLSLEACQSVDKAEWASKTLGGVRKFWIYIRGDLVGTFEVSGFEDHTSPDNADPVLYTNYHQCVLSGEVLWKSSPRVLLQTHGKEVGISSTEAHNMKERDTIAVLLGTKPVAFSRPLTQPFWPKGLRLDSQQTRSLDQIIEETLKQAPTVLRRQLGERGINYQGSQRVVGVSPSYRYTGVMDLNQDGKPEVYATVRWESAPCRGTSAHVLASWSGNRWTVLRRSIELLECPWANVHGDPGFEVSPVDIDGDGAPELVVDEWVYEAGKRMLFQIRSGQLVKILDIGGHGS